MNAFRNLGGRSRRKIGEGGNERAGEKERGRRNESAGRNHERQGSGGEVGFAVEREEANKEAVVGRPRKKELNKNGKEQGVTRCSIGIADPA